MIECELFHKNIIHVNPTSGDLLISKILIHCFYVARLERDGMVHPETGVIGLRHIFLLSSKSTITTSEKYN